MKKDDPILEAARRTIRMEAEAVAGLERLLTDGFTRSVDCLAACRGRIVVTGIGKSALIAQKIVATFNSTGSPALFLHAADAIHGDLGMVQAEDVVIIISKSGESPEIKVLLPLIRNFGNCIIALTGNTASYLARRADFLLDTTVTAEACPNNLAPTTSTTAQLVMGDALAVCLMEKRGFQMSDFARLHPGGALGKKLYLRVGDLYPEHGKPEVGPEDGLKEVIMEITRQRLGLTVVTGEGGAVLGIITDGDLRRMLEKTEDIQSKKAGDIMTAGPKTIEPSALAVTALDMMRQHSITQLVVAENGAYLGVIHLHDLVKEGLI